MKRLFFILLMAGVFSPAAVVAQDGQNPIRYSSLAQQFSTINTNGDANATALPSVAVQNGFGSFLYNPASMALIGMSYFNTGLLSNYAEQSNSYLGNSTSFDNNNTRFGNIGLIYSVPTERGSLVVGGGYTINNQINRTNILSAYNEQSTITDVFKNEASDYNDIAFEAYAIDYVDVEQTTLESIFRIGFTPANFPGIQQEAEIKQRGSVGEYSIFMATEVQRNLFIGASLGVTYGDYSYERYFLETDSENAYNGDFIDTDNEGNGGTDVADILLEDQFDSEIVGANIRAGLLYKLLPNINVGASFLLPTRFVVTEDYYSEITTNLDDGRTPFGDSYTGEFSYSVRRPGQLNLGLALEDINGFTVSTAVEIIDYRNTDIDLTRDNDLEFRDIAALREQEAAFDSVMKADYNLVTNLKAGLKYKSDTGFEIRGGFGILPGKSSSYSADKIVLSGGLGIPLSRELYLDVTTQYTRWNDRSILYEYFDAQSGQERSESINETISHINLMVGFKYRF
ncbi:MAG: hypothetical protein ACMZ7B_12905 [Balneola sp.]